MTATLAKFTFDLDMSQRPEDTQVLAKDKLADMLDAARKEGFEQGHAQGEQSELARAAQATLAAANKVAQQSAQLAGAADQMRKDALGEAVHLGAVVGKKLAVQLITREPTLELNALISECMATLDEAPHLVIRCHPELADAIRETTEQHMTTSGFSGRLVIMGEPEIPPGDGRIEWVDGGLIRDTAAISKQIDACIDDYLNARGISNAKETEQ